VFRSMIVDCCHRDEVPKDPKSDPDGLLLSRSRVLAGFGLRWSAHKPALKVGNDRQGTRGIDARHRLSIAPAVNTRAGLSDGGIGRLSPWSIGRGTAQEIESRRRSAWFVI
jgi:hypothetical protein